MARAAATRSPRKAGTESVDLSLRMLEHIARAAEPVGVSELARACGSSKATVYRHLCTLGDHGFARQDAATLRYTAGIKLFLLGERLRERFAVLPMARPAMTRLRDETGHAVTLATLIDGQLVVLEVLQGKTIVNFGTQAGTVLALHASAHGKVALAFGGDGVLQRCLSGRLQALTAHTICAAGPLERAVAHVRARGWATAPNQVIEGINGLAAPIFDHEGRYAGSIAIAGTVQAIPGSPPVEQVRAITRAASRVSQDLGWTRA